MCGAETQMLIWHLFYTTLPAKGTASAVPFAMISVPGGTGDICFANDIRFADDMRCAYKGTDIISCCRKAATYHTAMAVYHIASAIYHFVILRQIRRSKKMPHPRTQEIPGSFACQGPKSKGGLSTDAKARFFALLYSNP